MQDSNLSSATHFSLSYGDLNYYRQDQRRHLNQVSEEWQTLTVWSEWDSKKGQWVDVGDGFSPRLLKPLAELALEVEGASGFGPG